MGQHPKGTSCYHRHPLSLYAHAPVASVHERACYGTEITIAHRKLWACWSFADNPRAAGGVGRHTRD